MRRRWAGPAPTGMKLPVPPRTPPRTPPPPRASPHTSPPRAPPLLIYPECPPPNHPRARKVTLGRLPHPYGLHSSSTTLSNTLLQHPGMQDCADEIIEHWQCSPTLARHQCVVHLVKTEKIINNKPLHRTPDKTPEIPLPRSFSNKW